MWIRVFKSNRMFENTRMNIKHSNTNRLQKTIEYNSKT